MAERTPSTPRLGSCTLSSVSSTPTPAPLPKDIDTHPVEVVGRIREHPDGNGQPSVLQALPNGRDLRITSKEHQQGYRVFSLDGVSKAEDENLEAFYLKYAEARVEDVKLGGKCTVMMYGPTGAGKSHTMFGSGSERGVAYHALIQIMGDGLLDETGRGQEVKATVWEIFNEDIYDLLAQTSNPAGSMKGQTNRVKLEVKGKKVRNSTCINDYDPNRLLKEIQKVEKRRVVKSTNCNDRSSRSHCVVTFEVPAVDGRLVLVDMAGSENIEQAGVGSESKMQTGKINQGNGALKRVVEAIANGEHHIPYRDSKLTMILQESFEDKNAKVLMILCASPCPKDLYKTLGTFEYGAKAKRIVRLPNSPAREKASEEEQQKLAVVNAKDVAKDACILKLRREKEKSDREGEMKLREVKDLRKRVHEIESQLCSRESDSEIQLHEFRRQADLLNGLTKRKLEDLEQQLQQKEKEAEFQRLRADKAEAELNQLKRISFSHLESDQESADWGSMKQHSALAIVKVESPGNRPEKVRGLSPLSVKDNKSNAFGSSSSPSPKEKKDKKFSSSVLSFFKGSDSSHSSKRSSNGNKLESKARESPHHQLASPKSEKSSEKKRQAGQEAPSPKTAEKKRHTTGQDAALKAITWQPSTLQELLKVKQEQGNLDGRESSKKPTLEDAHMSWFTNLTSKFSDGNAQSMTKDSTLPDAPQTNTDSEMRSSTPDDPQVSISYVSDYEEEELSRQVEKDPLGLGTWSESKLHRRGWLPIIVEEKEEELEKLARRSLEEAANRASASCPRFSDGPQFSKFGFNSSQNSSSATSSTDLPCNNFFPSNLLRDKFSSPMKTTDEGRSLGKRMEPGAVVPSDDTLHRSNSAVTDDSEEVRATSALKNAEGSVSTLRSGSPVDSFLQRLGPSLSDGDGYGDRSELTGTESKSSEGKDDPPPVIEAASARKARIENIFLLCGHRREIAARSGADSPSQSVPASPIVREDRDQGANLRSDSFRDNLRSDSFRDFSLGEPMSPFPTSVPSSPLPSYRESPLPSFKESPRPSFRERDNQSHLSLEVEGYYSPARSPFRTTSGSFENRLRSPVSPEVITSVSSPLLPVLPSPQKSDSPSRHRKFRTGNLFQFPQPNDQDPTLPGTPEGATVLSPGSGSPAYSVRKPRSEANGYGDENEARSNSAGDHIPQCDVYVKWESKDTTGKLVCVLKLPKGASLADLRREILPHIPTAREGFTFLMLGDTGGAPVEQELESDLRVSSLPDCPINKGSRLASLRPPITHQLYIPPSRPFRPIENTVSANLLENGSNGGKLMNSKSGLKLGNSNGKAIQSNGNSSSLVKGLRTLATGVGLRGGQTLKEKGSSDYVQHLASKVIT